MNSPRMFTAWVLAAAAAVTGPARADTLICGIKDVTTILDGRGSSRILFNLDSAGPSGDFSIARATLTFDLTGVAVPGQVLRLRVHPVTSPWTAGAASWTVGWTRAGGDFDDTVFSRTELDVGRQGTVSVDVTSIVKEVLQARMTAYGFILTTDPAQSTALSAPDLTRLQSLGSATVEVTYRNTPRRPTGK